MIGKIIFVVLILIWFDVTSCDVHTEIQELKADHVEIKNMLKEVLSERNETSKSENIPSSKKLYKPGSLLVLASKTTSGVNVRIQVEVFLMPSDVAMWRINDASFIAKANDSMFGTSYRQLGNTTLFTLETNMFVRYATFITFNDEDTVTVFKINMTAEDGTTHYNLPTCQPSFSEIFETSVNFTFRCIPELDPRDSWKMNVGVFGTFESNTSDVVDIRMLQEGSETKYDNLTLERETTVKANIVGFKEIIKKMGEFLFLFSSLTFDSSGVVASTAYSIIQDVSKRKTEGEFKFLQYVPDIELLEGEPFTIGCDAIGRNPPPTTIRKDGGSIIESEAETRLQASSHVWSSSYVTYRHATKELAGNYSCVADNNGKKLVSPKYTVKLSPRFLRDLSTTLENDPSQTRVSLVVEGAIGVSLECNADENRGGNLMPSRVKTTPMSDWNERVEAEYTWRTDQINDQFYNVTYLSCELKDRNDEIDFYYYI